MFKQVFRLLDQPISQPSHLMTNSGIVVEIVLSYGGGTATDLNRLPY